MHAMPVRLSYLVNLMFMMPETAWSASPIMHSSCKYPTGETHTRDTSTKRFTAKSLLKKDQNLFVAQGPAAVSGGEAAGVHRWAAECWALGPACLPGPGKPLPTATHTPLPFVF